MEPIDRIIREGFEQMRRHDDNAKPPAQVRSVSIAWRPSSQIHPANRLLPQKDPGNISLELDDSLDV